MALAIVGDDDEAFAGGNDSIYEDDGVISPAPAGPGESAGAAPGGDVGGGRGMLPVLARGDVEAHAPAADVHESSFGDGAVVSVAVQRAPETPGAGGAVFTAVPDDTRNVVDGVERDAYGDPLPPPVPNRPTQQQAMWSDHWYVGAITREEALKRFNDEDPFGRLPSTSSRPSRARQSDKAGSPNRDPTPDTRSPFFCPMYDERCTLNDE